MEGRQDIMLSRQKQHQHVCLSNVSVRNVRAGCELETVYSASDL